MVGNHVLLLRLHVAVKINFRRYTSLNENFEYSYPVNSVPRCPYYGVYILPFISFARVCSNVRRFGK